MAHEDSSTSVNERARASEYHSFDLLVAAIIALLNATLIYIDIAPVAIRVILGVPLLFFLPGYALVSTLFPRGEWARRQGERPTYTPINLTLGERFAISFATSVALIPIVGLVMGIAGLPYTTSTILGVLSGMTIVGVVAADITRLRIPKSDRYYLPVRKWITSTRADGGRRSIPETIATIALIVSVIIALSTFGYALGVPQQGETYSDFYVLDGEGENYSEFVLANQSNDQTLVIHNREGGMEYYTIVITQQILDQSNSVVEERELYRFSAWVFDGERYTREISTDPDGSDRPSRVVYYLFKGDAPESVTTDTAYRWLSVETVGMEDQQLNSTVDAARSSDGTSDDRFGTGSEPTNSGNESSETNQSNDSEASSTSTIDSESDDELNGSSTDGSETIDEPDSANESSDEESTSDDDFGTETNDTDDGDVNGSETESNSTEPSSPT